MTLIYLILFFISIFFLVYFVFVLLKHGNNVLPQNTVSGGDTKNKVNNKRLKVFLFISAFILISLLLNVIYALIITVAAAYILWNASENRRQKYSKNIDKQIFELIRLFRNSVSAGESFVQSIDSVSKQIKEPLSSEFKDILNKVNRGISLDTALKNSAENIQNEQYGFFTDSLRLSFSTGIKMSDILLKIEESLNRKMALSAKVDVLTSQVRFSGNIVSFIPFVILFLVYLFEQDMISTLFTTLPGNIILFICIIMILTGAFVMKKIADIKL